MQTLQEKLFQTSRFLVGTELVSVRGGMAERSAAKARTFANELVASPDIDWISVTDNAGGNPQFAPRCSIIVIRRSTQPLQGRKNSGVSPRVARSSQPRAG